MAAIAIGVGVNPDDPVMKPRGDFIRLVCSVFDPVVAIINELTQF